MGDCRSIDWRQFTLPALVTTCSIALAWASDLTAALLSVSTKITGPPTPYLQHLLQHKAPQHAAERIVYLAYQVTVHTHP
jgi:hypothetical protein